MNLLDYINNNSDNAYKDFKLVSVIFDEINLECTFKFLYKNNIKDNDKEIILNLISQYINEPNIKIIVKCKKAYVDETLVKDVLYNFILRNYASVIVGFDKNNINVNICTGENALETYRIIELVLEKYYNGRKDAFWEREETWEYKKEN